MPLNFVECWGLFKIFEGNFPKMVTVKQFKNAIWKPLMPLVIPHFKGLRKNNSNTDSTKNERRNLILSVFIMV